MTGIVGIEAPGQVEIINQMLNSISHRGKQGHRVVSFNNCTLGVCWPFSQPGVEHILLEHHRAEEAINEDHFASAQITNNTFTLSRDPLGISPLYYGFMKGKILCFASEAKALLGVVQEIHEVPPGSTIVGGVVKKNYQLFRKPELVLAQIEIASELRRNLMSSIEKRLDKDNEVGILLSGGLNSSALAAITKNLLGKKIHTFTVGMRGASDLEYSQLVAKHLASKHFEIIPNVRELINLIPDVIYHLETFDLYVVRAGLMNYVVSKYAADYVQSIITGEGGDELFGGKPSLRRTPYENLTDDLINLTNQLHNTNLQRIDRCAEAFGMVAYVPFLDQNVVDFAFQIPPLHKMFEGKPKWILRRAVYDLLPQRIINRGKESFWEGSGILNNIEKVADEKISDHDFQHLRILPNGDKLRSKEEAYYFRFFQEHFGNIEDNISWIGRT